MATRNVPAQAAKTQVEQWQEQLAKEAAAAASTEAPTSEFVSFRGGILSWAGQPVEGNRKNVIVLDSAYEHVFYPHAFDPDALRSPDCWAVGRVESELTPDHEDVENKQADACEGCPMNEWGSDLEGGKGKACKDSYILALLPPDAEEGAPLVTLELSATAIKPFEKYVRDLARDFGKAPYCFVTEFYFDDASDFPSVRCGSPQIADSGLIALAYSQREEANKLLSVEPQTGDFEEKVVAKRSAKSKGKPNGRVAR